MKKPIKLENEPKKEFRNRCIQWVICNHKNMTIERIRNTYEKNWGYITDRTLSRTLATMRLRDWAQPYEDEDGTRVYEAIR